MTPYLLAFEEALFVTVGDVQRQRQDSRRVLHALDHVIQPSPAWTLHRTDTHMSVRTINDNGVCVRVCSVCVRVRARPRLCVTYELQLQFVQGERRVIQVAGGPQPSQLLGAVLGLLHGLGLPTADVVPAV